MGECGISKELLQRMRQEFNFWYPWNLRVSGKVGCWASLEHEEMDYLRKPLIHMLQKLKWDKE